MKILVAYPTRSSFVARDIRILGERCEVDELPYCSNSPAYMFKGISRIAHADLLFMWFISPRTIPLVAVAKALGKPIIGLVGGYEAANCPEIEYGSARKHHLRSFTRMLLNTVDAIVAPSCSSRDSIVTNLGIHKDRVSVIYHGFEDIAPSTASATKLPMVLSVGEISKENWRTKGQLDFMLAASKMPEIPFVYVGAVLDDPATLLGTALPENVTLTGRKRFEELPEYYSQAKVYLQLSRHESFGCAVAEAMLCRCIPVVRGAYALPEVVGSAGVIVDDSSEESLVSGIRSALASGDGEGEKARQRVLQTFPLEHRTASILGIVECLIGH